MADVRAALALLPRGAITGIGSLPHTQMELALQMALSGFGVKLGGRSE